MRIVELQPAPFHTLPYSNVSSSRQVVAAQLPFLRATVDSLPAALDAIIVAADLQGREMADNYSRPTKLLGEMLAAEIGVLRERGELPSKDKTAVIVAGDLFARPDMDRRGGSGDVRPAWLALAGACRWIVGVAGNHDVFGPRPSIPDFQAFLRTPGVHFLDDVMVEIDGLKIAGLSGIVGNPRKPFRREEQAFADALGYLALAGPDLLIAHDGPDIENTDLRGWASIRRALEASRPTLMVRGHAHWDKPVASLANGTQVLNVDARVVVLRRR
ncbi:MAG: metallophosphoesterase [Phycisphaeraceae bacterium]|nr:metallophosphoesterase [Phycisphaeraceae bacterium]